MSEFRRTGANVILIRPKPHKDADAIHWGKAASVEPRLSTKGCYQRHCVSPDNEHKLYSQSSVTDNWTRISSDHHLRYFNKVNGKFLARDVPMDLLSSRPTARRDRTRKGRV